MTDRLSDPIQDYKDLNVWQVSMRVAREVYRASACMSDDERYGLCSQMTRAAVSVPSNIAEGYDRGSRSEYLHFVKIARGSAAELETQILLATDLELLPPEPATELLELVDRMRKMLWGLAAALERKKS